MKLTIVLLTATFLQVYASGRAQKITLKGENIAITDVFSAIKAQSGYGVFSSKELLKNAKPVTVDVLNMPLADFLRLTLSDQPFRFVIADKTVIISEKATTREIDPELVVFNPIRGKVLDEDGQPLAGASISVKNAKTLGVSNADGLFTLNVNEGDILVITYVEHETKEIRINSSMISSGLLSVTLSKSTSKLDQVQVIAYGANTKRFSVGAVNIVDAATIEKQPVPNVLLALQGQVPGLVITPTGGAPGSAVKLQIRGQNSLRTNAFQVAKFDQPLFIVDGVPFAAQNNSMGNLLTYNILTRDAESLVAGNGISPFGNINPSDIESISVLKDADATSIYGSQGGNGVILITTKKGTPGKGRLSIRVNNSVNIPTRPLKMMNTDQYLSVRREALANDKVVLTPSNVFTYPDLQIFDPKRNVDWYGEFFDRKPINTDVYASFSGGQNNTTFILSGGYTHTPYNFPGNFADDRLTLHSGYTYRSTNNKLTVQFGTDYAYSKNNASSQPSVSAAMSMAPNFPEMVDPQGNLIWRYNGYSLFSSNQYGRLRSPGDVQMHNLNIFARLVYQITPNLSISNNIGYSRTTGKNYSARPLAAQDPSSTLSKSTATFTDNIYQAVNLEPQANYQRQLGGGVISALLGGTYKKDDSYTGFLTGINYPNDDLLNSVAGAATVTGGNSKDIHKYIAGYARIGYIQNKRYIINLTGRRDGSSNFGPGRRYGNFGSAGLGWIFSEERFFASAFPFISYAKLSANYGTNGSDVIQSYRYRANYVSNFPSSYQGARPYTPENLFNPGYSWAIKKSWNASLDLGLFKDQILLNVTGYLNRATDELLAYVLPAQTGFSDVLGNFPATVQNKGLEISINSTNIHTQNFKWTSNFNIGLNRNIIAAFPGLENSSYASFYVVGKSPNLVNGYKYSGVNANTGLFEFYNAKGQLTSSPINAYTFQGGDVQPLFDTDPKFSGGLGNTITYKNFSLTMFVQFSKRRSLNYLYGIYSYGLPGNLFNLPEAVIDRYWQVPGDQAELQKLSAVYGQATASASAFINSSGAYSDASYLRLKTVSFAYTVPYNVLKKLGVNNCQLYLNAQNLFTITGYKLGDPEQPGALYNIPLQRTISGGLSFNF